MKSYEQEIIEKRLVFETEKSIELGHMKALLQVQLDYIKALEKKDEQKGFYLVSANFKESVKKLEEALEFMNKSHQGIISDIQKDTEKLLMCKGNNNDE